MGLQGKAVVHDLEQSAIVDAIVVADIAPEAANAYAGRMGYRKVQTVALDAGRPEGVDRLLRETQPQVLIGMLPPDFQPAVARAAVRAGVHYVSSSYTGALTELDGLARERGVTLLPEMGMDPGIDLILGRLAVDELDVVYGLRSYGPSRPAPATTPSATRSPGRSRGCSRPTCGRPGCCGTDRKSPSPAGGSSVRSTAIPSRCRESA
jgi:saccharopine dehydrogenase-like NADP-dependent oxidoreductase